jgi:hypothetical protein
MEMYYLYFVVVGIYAYIVLMEEGKHKEEELEAELRAMVRQRIASFAQPDKILVSTVILEKVKYFYTNCFYIKS